MLTVNTANLASHITTNRGHILFMILDEVRDFIFVKDNRCRFIYNNRAHLEHLGCAQEDILGRTDFDIFPKALADAFYFDEKRLLDSRVPIIKVQESVNARGEMFFTTALKQLVCSPRGEVLGFFGIVRRLLANDRSGLEKTHRDILEALRRDPGTTPQQLRAFETSLPMLLSRASVAAGNSTSPVPPPPPPAAAGSSSQNRPNQRYAIKLRAALRTVSAAIRISRRKLCPFHHIPARFRPSMSPQWAIDRLLIHGLVHTARTS